VLTSISVVASRGVVLAANPTLLQPPPREAGLASLAARRPRGSPGAWSRPCHSSFKARAQQEPALPGGSPAHALDIVASPAVRPSPGRAGRPGSRRGHPSRCRPCRPSTSMSPPVRPTFSSIPSRRRHEPLPRRPAVSRPTLHVLFALATASTGNGPGGRGAPVSNLATRPITSRSMSGSTPGASSTNQYSTLLPIPAHAQRAAAHAPTSERHDADGDWRPPAPGHRHAGAGVLGDDAALANPSRASGEMGPGLPAPRSRARARDSARQAIPLRAATESKRISASGCGVVAVQRNRTVFSSWPSLPPSVVADGPARIVLHQADVRIVTTRRRGRRAG